MASLCGICPELRAEGTLWRGGNHRTEAVSLLMITLAQYVVDGTKAAGQAALRRSGDLSERFRVVAQGVRTFHAQNARVATIEAVPANVR